MRAHGPFLTGCVFAAWLTRLAAPCLAEPATTISLRLDIIWGQRSASVQPFFVSLSARELALADAKLTQGETGDVLQNGVARTSAGAGDIDGLSCVLQFEQKSIEPITNAHSIWKHLWKHGDAEATQRLQSDPAYRPDPRKLTVQLEETGTRGFSLTVDQLLKQKVFWLPEFDVFVSAGEPLVSFAAHLLALEPKRGQRVLDQVARDPEATYAQYTARWEDMGSPSYKNPQPVPPGHIVGLTWDSALYKFGVDRFAEVRNDYGELERFHLTFDFGDARHPLAKAWKGQRLTDGLPVITTTFEKDGVRCEVEQFAFPLDGPPAERRGDIKMVLLQKVRLTELAGTARTAAGGPRAVPAPSSLDGSSAKESSLLSPSSSPLRTGTVRGPVPVRVVHERDLPAEHSRVSAKTQPASMTLEDGGQRTLFVVEGAELAPQVSEVALSGSDIAQDKKARIRKNRIELAVALPANGSREFIVKLPLPALPPAENAKLLALDYAASRAATLKFWNDYLAKGALFHVPEDAVNTLFRANLWHALRLPRRHGGSGPEVKIDLPYSNFAYGQNGTPWPVNQSVYVDYMLYDLRGYHAISAEEHAAMYRNNQRTNGQVGGFANWGVYTPGMLYSVAQHYLLSGDRASLARLLPQTLRALDWCLGEMKQAGNENSPTPGLVLAPLNDLSHDARSWAFNQAYLVAGVDLLGRALAEMQHPRAAECREAAAAMRAAVGREFARASVRSPAVLLADGTWSPYVPCDAQASGRLFAAWYPTDVDTGPLHLARLKVLDPRGSLTTAMLHDHEDNLLIHQWGMINEPVYNQQATAYLLRDEPKPAIRAFYSMMACAFSHSVFEPVEHRWGWPQYFGPPSTDGAWFELYRHMLIHERDDDTLLLAQAAPRAWLENGKRIEVQRAPTYYGSLSFAVESRTRDGEITATIDVPQRKQPATLLVRFRHPQQQAMRSVTVNGQPWADFDDKQEWVRLPKPRPGRWAIAAKYDAPAR